MSTFVLIPGTSAGGWVWQPIARALRDAGHTVYPVTLTGLGERSHLLTPDVGLETHITDVVNVLTYEDLHDVVLVGHSYAGMVITGVADRVPERIGHLVYFDAIVPANGESCIDLLPPEQRADMEERVRSRGDGWRIPMDPPPDGRPVRNTEHPWKAWAEPLRLQRDALPDLPAAYMLFSADKTPGSYFEKVMTRSLQRAQERGWRLYEVDTIHQIVPDPIPKADVLLQFADDVGLEAG